MQNNTRQHRHQFDQGNPLAQKKILWATLVTAVMMVLEIAGGWVFQSMALLADGWHMSSHVLALGLAFIAYKAARHYADDPRFNMGTWRIEILAGYSSAILLVMVAVLMAWHSFERLLNPVEIHYKEAIPIAILGLVVNLVCAVLLHDGGHSEHNYGASDKDLNHQAAFVHVLTDALTSVFAIVALFAGKYLGWDILDAILGIFGSMLVGAWAIGLLKQTGKTLLDADLDAHVTDEIREVILSFGNRVVLTDLHVSKVGKGMFACHVTLQSAIELTPDQVRKALQLHEELVHISVEINPVPT